MGDIGSGICIFSISVLRFASSKSTQMLTHIRPFDMDENGESNWNSDHKIVDTQYEKRVREQAKRIKTRALTTKWCSVPLKPFWGECLRYQWRYHSRSSDEMENRSKKKEKPANLCCIRPWMATDYGRRYHYDVSKHEKVATDYQAISWRSIQVQGTRHALRPRPKMSTQTKFK